MSRHPALLLVALAACGGASPHPVAPGIRLEPVIEAQTWYAATTPCGQGPYELEVPVGAARYGEDVELRVHTPRTIALHAVMLVDGREVAVSDDRIGALGRTDAKADNARCLADARERLAIAHGGNGGGGGAGVAVPPGGVAVAPPPSPAITPQLVVDPGDVATSVEVLRFRVPSDISASGRVRIRLWSIEPNDLDGVRFGTVRIAWRPNVPEAEYEAFLAEAQRREQDRARREQERWRIEQQRADERARANVHVETEAERRARVEREERAAREAREREERARRDAEDRARREQIRAALERDRQARREAFCAAHHEDRGCWGAGGYRVHAELDARAREREAFCAGATEDARCWSTEEWSKRRSVWDRRVVDARRAQRPPDGPPPAPLAEDVPPKLSPHAEWRAGYWQWLGGAWVWLAGMWRVPDSDLAAELTTEAPVAPPPPKPETPPPPPATVTVWIAGFWQWNGTGWVWIPGSYQVRPSARVTWRAPEWRVRGAAHVLVPGAWIQLGGGR